MTRHEAREQAFLLLFDKSFHPEIDLEQVIALAAEDGMIALDDFAKSTVENVCAVLDDIDDEIEQNLQGWKMNRISRVSLSVLRLAFGELRQGGTPEGVIVHEAVELCKAYASAEEAAFVNGVLRAYLRQKEAE